MAKDKHDEHEGHVHRKVNVNVQDKPVLYTDAVLLTSDPNGFGVVLNFAQHTGEDLHIVSRVGMSMDHAHNFLETLNNHLGKQASKK
ncbi:MAG: hypothetical protein R3313_05600 [Candidatus Saccharimonadales bacterium]|nr:hypothetical protein [Candidatus Saccharimonadales bacterium]